MWQSLNSMGNMSSIFSGNIRLSFVSHATGTECLPQGWAPRPARLAHHTVRRHRSRAVLFSTPTLSTTALPVLRLSGTPIPRPDGGGQVFAHECVYRQRKSRFPPKQTTILLNDLKLVDRGDRFPYQDRVGVGDNGELLQMFPSVGRFWTDLHGIQGLFITFTCLLIGLVFIQAFSVIFKYLCFLIMN